MDTRAEKKISRRKWASRSALLVVLLIYLLLTRCGDQPKPVSSGDGGAVLSQENDRRDRLEQGQPVPEPQPPEPLPPHGSPQVVESSKSPEVERAPKPDRPVVAGGASAVASAPKPTEQSPETAPLPQQQKGEELPVEPEGALEGGDQYAAGFNEPRELMCPGPPTRLTTEAAASGRTFIDPVTRMSFVLVKGGCFRMGSDIGDRDERPVHEVCVDDFYMGEYEVTQAQYEWIMGHNPSSFQRCDLPVESVSWDDAQAYIRKLNQASGTSYRLPSEAEWEYAATTGRTIEEIATVDPMHEYAAYMRNLGSSNSQARRVANAWGLYDMEFNVWEWVSDWYGAKYYASSPRTNPQGPPSGSHRVIRAASRYESRPRFNKRYAALPSENHDYFGFRIAFPARSFANDPADAREVEIANSADAPPQNNPAIPGIEPASGAGSNQRL